MTGNDNEQRKQSSRQQQGEASNDNQQVSHRDRAGETGARGEAVNAAGNKVHGDKLEGMIPGKSQSQDDNRAEADGEDRDADGEGELK